MFLVAGSLSDHLGRRPVLLVATLAQAVTMIVFITATSVTGLLVARVLQGLTTGAALGAIGAGMIDLAKTRGTVLTVRDDDRVVVQNINMIKRHTMGNPIRGTPGGIFEREAAIHVSNFALFYRAKGGADRTVIMVLDDGMKVRYFKSYGEGVDV